MSDSPSPSSMMGPPSSNDLAGNTSITSLKTAAQKMEPPKGRALSCEQCKKRKIRCNRETPCGPCILRNDQARCKPVIRWEAGCSLSEFTILQNRVNELEERFESMQRAVEGGVGEGRRLSFSNASSSKYVMGASNTQNANNVNNTSAPRDGENDAVMMLEDFAMGNRANARRAAQKLVPKPGLLSSRPGDSPDPSRLETAVNQRSADPAADVAYRFLRLAPPPETQRQIVHYYFERLEWYTKCLYRPNYMEDMNLLLSLDLETAARSVRPTFLCVHFMVICLAIHLCSGEEVLLWGYDRVSAQSLCDALFAGSQQLLWSSDFIGSHQLEHLQAVVLMSVYAYNVDEQADAAYALVGASIKIAQNLALNRLDDVRFLEKERQKNKSAGASAQQQQSPLERELGKRVWWYLVWLDWSHALSHGGCYAIHPSHNRTNLPANINDEDLTASATVVPKPLEEYTSMSFTIWKLRFLDVYRQTIDLLNGPTGMTHTQLTEMDKKLMEMLNGLPSYFQLRMDEQDHWTFGDSCHDMELLSIQITGWNRLLRLHRPFLARGLLDKNSVSRKRCVDAAYNILACFRHAKKHAPLLLKVWIHVYYVFSGALVLFLDLCYDDGSDSKATEDKRKAIREMLDICDTARHLSAAAKNTYNLLLGLLEAETELRVHQGQGKDNFKPNSKRKRAKTESNSQGVAFSPFVSLVERVLVDAASKNSSGDSASSSLGRSPNEYTGSVGGLFEPPAKRHTTSFVRDRHSSMSNSDNRYNCGGINTGHGNYGVKDVNSTQNGQMQSYTNTGSFSGPPLSPWSTSSSRGGGNGGGANAWNMGGGFPSPTSGAFGNGGNLGNPSLYGTNVTMMSGNANLNGGGMRNTGAATTNGLSSLLDEDIFSGLLMNHMNLFSVIVCM
ncbi:uncharacterized protein FA14DRAFT_3483 [Meira miltonrushii]|uniref:Zn(2)-C6 fungal-type domain-containing protein n=1 Tax=Meira miltonrushii TaxID=1280837 RepID=A0A316VKE5_9BASI|nr:uncharacterized protein FA14DRAFT_3483 [Meira miltonrushii]PWN36511.1 hypothetical protein FA14DRAFT_3483 [Meira miltonrushii]